VRRKANVKTTADLTDQLRLSVIELSSNRAEVAADRTEEKVMITTAAEDAAAAEPEIRREARAADREAQGEGAENAADCVRIFIAADPRTVEVCEDFVRVRASDPALHTETKVTVDKVFRIQRATPGVIDGEIAVIPPIVSGP